MKWAFAGAIAVSAIVGIAAGARGISLIMRGIAQWSHQLDVKQPFGGDDQLV
jgi:hypothetical protein